MKVLLPDDCETHGRTVVNRPYILRLHIVGRGFHGLERGQRGVVGVRRHKESHARVLRLIKLNLLEPNRYHVAQALCECRLFMLMKLVKS